ncbi:LOW QUALITY PROTEIN: cathepsin E [Megaptera novaeangliae]
MTSSSQGRRRLQEGLGLSQGQQEETWMEPLGVEGLTEVGQQFEESVTETDQSFMNAESDGILGLGCHCLAAERGTLVFDTMARLVDLPVFSVYTSSDTGGGAGSELIFRGYDHSHLSGNIDVPVTKQGYWQIAVDTIQVGGTMMFFSEGAIVDPGASLITGPSGSSKQLHRSLGQRPWMGNWGASEWILCAVFLYTVECVNVGVLLDVTFTINGVPHTLQPTAYTLLKFMDGMKFLISGFQGSDIQPPTWSFRTLSNVSLNSFTAFEHGNNHVGLAPAVP